MRLAASIIAETPAPSLTEVCRRLGVIPKTIDKYEPELRDKITRQYREWKAEDLKFRHAQLYLEINEIAIELNQQGIRPSRRQILKLIPHRQKASWNVINDGISLAMREAQGVLKICSDVGRPMGALQRAATTVMPAR
jgi:hypothetical protein